LLGRRRQKGGIVVESEKVKGAPELLLFRDSKSGKTIPKALFHDDWIISKDERVHKPSPLKQHGAFRSGLVLWVVVRSRVPIVATIGNANPATVVARSKFILVQLVHLGVSQQEMMRDNVGLRGGMLVATGGVYARTLFVTMSV